MGVTLDDNWENGPMIRRAGIAAFGLYCACGLWIARHTSDGFVPADVAADLGTREWAAKLVDAGFWKVVEGGFQDLHYLALNPSAEKVRERRQKDADRKARWRDRKSGTQPPPSMSRRDTARDGTRDTTRDKPDVPLGQDAGLRSSPAAPPKGGAGVRAHAHVRARASPPGDDVTWRDTPPIDAPVDPAEAQRVHKRAAAARAAIRKPPTTQETP